MLHPSEPETVTIQKRSPRNTRENYAWTLTTATQRAAHSELSVMSPIVNPVLLASQSGITAKLFIAHMPSSAENFRASALLSLGTAGRTNTNNWIPSLTHREYPVMIGSSSTFLRRASGQWRPNLRGNISYARVLD